MVLFATGLIVLGGISALMGQKLFRLLLPLLGLITGVMVGFGGTQAIFGTGVVSTGVALLAAVAVGLLMAVLSFVFYSIAVVIFMALLGSTAMTYLGIAIGLNENGLVLFLMGLAGAILGLVYAMSSTITIDLVFIMTAMLGVAWIMAGVLLLVGNLDVSDLREDGIIRSIVATVDQSFLWFFVWIGGTAIASAFQRRVAIEEFLGDNFAYNE